MDRDDVTKRIKEEEDYIRSPKFGNSLTRLKQKNPEGVDDSTIAKVLMLSEEEVQKIYDEAVVMLREGFDDE